MKNSLLIFMLILAPLVFLKQANAQGKVSNKSLTDDYCQTYLDNETCLASACPAPRDDLECTPKTTPNGTCYCLEKREQTSEGTVKTCPSGTILSSDACCCAPVL